MEYILHSTFNIGDLSPHHAPSELRTILSQLGRNETSTSSITTQQSTDKDNEDFNIQDNEDSRPIVEDHHKTLAYTSYSSTLQQLSTMGQRTILQVIKESF